MLCFCFLALLEVVLALRHLFKVVVAEADQQHSIHLIFFESVRGQMQICLSFVVP